MILAGNVSPIDVITHIPVLCEENDVPYIYVPSKEDLGGSGVSRKASCCMLIYPDPPAKHDMPANPEFDELYKECSGKVKSSLAKAVENNFC